MHNYLGITLEYSENKVLRVHMKNDVELTLKEFPYELENKGEKYPWSKHLFKNLNNHNEILEKESMEIFHTFSAKGLFSAKQGSPDVMPGSVYLSTKVRSPNANDWDKLTNLLRFSRKTKKISHG
jgi:hypothetical protein